MSWPALVILFDDAPLEHPATCPDGGQDRTHTIVIPYWRMSTMAPKHLFTLVALLTVLVSSIGFMED